MKLIVCGGREYDNYEIVKFVLNGIHATYGIKEIVQGGAKGADNLARRWAKEHNITLREFQANWEIGKHAGPQRNERMACYADACIAFPGGRGTDDMMERAVRRRMQFWDFRQHVRRYAEPRGDKWELEILNPYERK